MNNLYFGTVQKGKQRGRTMGFPTANIPSNVAPSFGAYAGTVTLDSAVLPAAVYSDPDRKILEAHILDFDEDIYGKEITITLLTKVAERQPFVSKEAMMKTIGEAVQKVRDYFQPKP